MKRIRLDTKSSPLGSAYVDKEGTVITAIHSRENAVSCQQSLTPEGQTRRSGIQTDAVSPLAAWLKRGETKVFQQTNPQRSSRYYIFNCCTMTCFKAILHHMPEGQRILNAWQALFCYRALTTLARFFNCWGVIPQVLQTSIMSCLSLEASNSCTCQSPTGAIKTRRV